MSDDSDKKNTGLWKFTVGAVLLMVAAPGFFGFLQTGVWVREATNRFPIQLYGADAAFFYFAFGIAGLYLVVSGYKSATKSLP